MNDMHEAVVLPDPAVQRLLHPTDIGPARALYRRGWWFGRLGSLPVAVAIAAIIWAFSSNLMATLMAPISTFIIGTVASRWHISRSWDFIPRKRQRPDTATSWHLMATFIDAAALLVIALACIVSISLRPMQEGVVAFAVGAGCGVAVVQLLELVLAVVRGRGRAAIGQRGVMIGAVVVSSLLVGSFGISGPWDRELLLAWALGMASILLAQAVWWIVTTVRERQ